MENVRISWLHQEYTPESQIPSKAHRKDLWEQFKEKSPKCVNC